MIFFAIGVNQENTRLKKLLNMSMNEIELSVRAANCLNNANITMVGQPSPAARHLVRFVW